MSCMVARRSELSRLCSRFTFIICDDSMNAKFVSLSINDVIGSLAGELYLAIGLLAPSGVATGGPTPSSSCLRVCGSSDEDASWQWFAMKF
jgi:hypothetical protein